MAIKCLKRGFESNFQVACCLRSAVACHEFNVPLSLSLVMDKNLLQQLVHSTYLLKLSSRLQRSKKCADPGLFFIYFQSFQSNITIFTTNQCEKCPSSIGHRDSNSQPSDYEIPPLTTRPGLPPKRLQRSNQSLCAAYQDGLKLLLVHHHSFLPS